MATYKQDFEDKLKIYIVACNEVTEFQERKHVWNKETIEQSQALRHRRDDWRLYTGVLFAYKLYEEGKLNMRQIAELSEHNLHQIVLSCTKSMVRYVPVTGNTPEVMALIITIGTKYAKMVEEFIDQKDWELVDTAIAKFEADGLAATNVDVGGYINTVKA